MGLARTSSTERRRDGKRLGQGKLGRSRERVSSIISQGSDSLTHLGTDAGSRNVCENLCFVFLPRRLSARFPRPTFEAVDGTNGAMCLDCLNTDSLDPQ